MSIAVLLLCLGTLGFFLQVLKTLLFPTPKLDFKPSSSVSVEVVRATNPDCGDLVSLMQRIRVEEASNCKHAFFSDEGATFDLRLPSLMNTLCAVPQNPAQNATQDAIAELFRSDPLLFSRASYMHMLGTSVEAFLARHYSVSKSFYFAAIMIDSMLSTDEDWFEALRLTRKRTQPVVSAHRLLLALQDAIPCQCLELEDPTSLSYFPARNMDFLGSPPPPPPIPRGLCHTCFQSSQEIKTVSCQGCTNFVKYCSIACLERDSSVHHTVCGRQPSWWSL